jgi:hypothetical protein
MKCSAKIVSLILCYTDRVGVLLISSLIANPLISRIKKNLQISGMYMVIGFASAEVKDPTSANPLK